MTTTLENTWIPEGGSTNDLVGGWMKVKAVQKDTLNFLSHIVFRGYRGKGSSSETCPKVKIIRDAHSDLTSDDLLWYIRGMKDEELGVLKRIKVKDDSMTIPRVLSAKIKLAIKDL